MPLKVLIIGTGSVFDSYPPLFGGGIENRIWNISKELASKVEITILASNPNKTIEKPIKKSFNQVKIIEFQNKSKFFTRNNSSIAVLLKKIRQVVHFLRIYIAHLRLEAFDIIHVHNIYSALGIVSFLKIIKKDMKIVYTIQNWDVWEKKPKGIIENLGWGIDFLFERLFLKFCTKLVIVSKNLRDRMVKLRNRAIIKQSSVIPNGVDLTLFKNKSKNQDESKIQDKIFHILFVGVLRKEKNVSTLLRAVAHLKKNGYKVILNIVGDGLEKLRLIELSSLLGISEKVIFHGRLQLKNLIDFYGASDVLILPSTHEPFGMVLLEAMASGKPVIASNIGGIAEIVQNNSNGFLFSPLNHKELANNILNLIENPELRMKFGKRSRELIEEKYSWSHIASDLYNIYEEVNKK